MKNPIPTGARTIQEERKMCKDRGKWRTMEEQLRY